MMGGREGHCQVFTLIEPFFLTDRFYWKQNRDAFWRDVFLQRRYYLSPFDIS